MAASESESCCTGPPHNFNDWRLCHQRAAESRPAFSRRRDSVNGLPQCKRCLKKFTTWQLLDRHINGGHCAERRSTVAHTPDAEPATLSVHPAPTSGEIMPLPLAHHESMQTLLRQHGRNMIFHVKNRQRYIQRCLLCGQWTATSKIMKTHYKGTHPLIHSLSLEATNLCKSFPSGGVPCQLLWC